MIVRLTVSLAVLAVLLVPASFAFAQQYPSVDGTLAVEDTNDASNEIFEPGDAVHITGGGYEPGSTVTVTIESTPQVLAVTQADATGTISVQVRVPDGFDVGAHTLKATGPAVGGGVLVLEQPVTVVAAGADPLEAPAPGSSADQLPHTGSDAALLLTIAGLALVLGSGAVIGARGRRVRA